MKLIFWILIFVSVFLITISTVNLIFSHPDGTILAEKSGMSFFGDPLPMPPNPPPPPPPEWA